MLVKTRFLVESSNFDQISICWSKIEIFGHKSAFWSIFEFIIVTFFYLSNFRKKNTDRTLLKPKLLHNC